MLRATLRLILITLAVVKAVPIRREGVAAKARELLDFDVELTSLFNDIQLKQDPPVQPDYSSVQKVLPSEDELAVQSSSAPRSKISSSSTPGPIIDNEKTSNRDQPATESRDQYILSSKSQTASTIATSTIVYKSRDKLPVQSSSSPIPTTYEVNTSSRDRRTTESRNHHNHTPSPKSQPVSTTSTSNKTNKSTEDLLQPTPSFLDNNAIEISEMTGHDEARNSAQNVPSGDIQVKFERPKLTPTKSRVRFVKEKPSVAPETLTTVHSTNAIDQSNYSGQNDRVQANEPFSEQLVINGESKRAQTNKPTPEELGIRGGNKTNITIGSTTEKTITNGGRKRAKKNEINTSKSNTIRGNLRAQTNGPITNKPIATGGKQPVHKTRRITGQPTKLTTLSTESISVTKFDPNVSQTPVHETSIASSMGTRTGSRRSPTNAMTHSSVLRKNLQSNLNQTLAKWTNTTRHQPTQPFGQPVFIHHTEPTRRPVRKTTTTTAATFQQTTEKSLNDDDEESTRFDSTGTRNKSHSNFHAKPYFEISKSKLRHSSKDKKIRARPTTTETTVSSEIVDTNDDFQTNDLQTMLMTFSSPSTTAVWQVTEKTSKMPTSIPVTRKPPYRGAHTTQTVNYSTDDVRNSKVKVSQKVASVQTSTRSSRPTPARRFPHNTMTFITNRPAAPYSKTTRNRVVNFSSVNEYVQTTAKPSNTRNRKTSANKSKYYPTSYVITYNTLRKTK